MAVPFPWDCEVLQPPVAFWYSDDWRSRGYEADAIRRCMLGWDVKDFGHGGCFWTGHIRFASRAGHLTNGPPPQTELGEDVHRRRGAGDSNALSQVGMGVPRDIGG